MAVIEIENLTKDFYSGFWVKHPVRALDHLSLQVHKGEVFGFLGPNGAGKSTTLKILMNLLRPTSGTARILGKSVESVRMHQAIGYLPENPYFYDYLTAEELLTFAGKLFGLRPPDLIGRVDALLQNVGLADASKMQLRKFSKGMVQRIGIAQAIINGPEVVFLDEPMSGLDPLGRMDVRKIIIELKSRGVTVFFSSHILPDVEAICDRIAILNKGKLQEAGALDDILKMKIEGHEAILARWSEDVLPLMRECCDDVRPMGDRLHVRVRNQEQMQRLLSLTSAHRLELISLNPIRPSLEEYFQSAIGMRTEQKHNSHGKSMENTEF
jgi:ABC-2 type transport system ATP-binding protein